MRRKPLIQILSAILIVSACLYVGIVLLPGLLLPLVSESYWARRGALLEEQLAEGHRKCGDLQSIPALKKIVSRLVQSAPMTRDIPISVSVREFDVDNAWTLPGGRIILTSEALLAATRAEQVAALLAHELGHVLARHTERDVMRNFAIDMLSAPAQGAAGAGLLARLSFSREDEWEADRSAVAILQSAHISPQAMVIVLQHYLDMETARGASPGSGQMALHTHPPTPERLRALASLPLLAGAQPVLSEAEWQDLRAVCDLD